jgi:putative chitinase
MEELASGQAYEGRKDLGNIQPGDGKRFKGRGLIQLTGRSNYEQYSKDRGIDFIKNPELIATDPNNCVDVAGWYWNSRNLNKYADQDNVRKITKRINGGYNGLEDRIKKLEICKAILKT